MNTGGKTYYYTTMCQQHNCAGNRMYILTDRQRIVAYQVVYGKDDSFAAGTPEKTYVYGKPNAAELAYLKAEWRKEQSQ